MQTELQQVNSASDQQAAGLQADLAVLQQRIAAAEAELAAAQTRVQQLEQQLQTQQAEAAATEKRMAAQMDQLKMDVSPPSWYHGHFAFKLCLCGSMNVRALF